ncbi:MAG: hypothetical protein ACJ71W_21790 [Terriglobales bacterium]
MDESVKKKLHDDAERIARGILDGGPYDEDVLRGRISAEIELILVDVAYSLIDPPLKRCPTCGGRPNDRREKQVGNGRMDFVTCNDPFHN